MACVPKYFSLFVLVLVNFLILLLCCSSGTAQSTQANISLGSSLTALTNSSSSWQSPSGEFAFGFRKIDGQEGFLLAIWFNKIPQMTIVWSANGDKLVQEGSKVGLTELGLALSDPTGKQIMWAADIAATGVAYAAMLDTGNLVLANQDSVNLWESFNEPTDTLLPTQVLGPEKKLVARYLEANYSSGRFHFIMQQDGDLVLYTRAFPLDTPNFAYWSSGTVGSGFRLVFNQSGLVYLEANNGTILDMFSSNATSTQDFYQRAILEHDGVFRHYVYPKRDLKGWNMAWTMSTFMPPNICMSILEGTGSGACGYNSYCSLGDDQMPNCYCPNGYTLTDGNDPVKGCRPVFEAQSCDEDSHDASNFFFYAMESVDWPGSHYQHYLPVTEDWCTRACLGVCFCDAIFVKNGDCWLKQIPLRNGRLDLVLGGKTLIKLRKNNSTFQVGDRNLDKKDHRKLVLIGSVLLSASTFFNVLLLVVTFLVLFKCFKREKTEASQQNQAILGMNLRSFSYEELNCATNGFEEQLGRGSFGVVFKGAVELDRRHISVAVKKLDDMVREGEREFEAEVSAIGRTNHKNLVKLIGFCNEGQHRLLVYEFMRNGSLAGFLFGASRPNWQHRMQIALGIARGLFYLHEECSTQIIHCDIKPQNILLDDCFKARISDFGLAKILRTDQTRTTTGIRGTKGFVAPEWFKSMPVTTKVDVYSYGILLLEIIFCRKNFEAEMKDENQMALSDWAYDCYKESKLNLLLENDNEALSDMKQVEKYVMVAIWCIQDNPSRRPTMKNVIQMLEGTIEVLFPPDPSSSTS